MISIQLIEEQGHLWTLPRGKIFRAVDRYLQQEALRGRRDVSVLEALERTGMTARYRYRLRNPRRSPEERLRTLNAQLHAQLHSILEQHLHEFYSEPQIDTPHLRPAA
ncbi:MAG: hypothetical protein EPN48_18435 [Microbacteriaceae bacterium]|nr:MAG: hypothetical protein EPN48_18435 [Microbacteriaceae bacterium]